MKPSTWYAVAALIALSSSIQLWARDNKGPAIWFTLAVLVVLIARHLYIRGEDKNLVPYGSRLAKYLLIQLLILVALFPVAIYIASSIN